MHRMLFIASAMGIALLASGTAQAAHRTGEVTADKAKPAQNIMEMARRGRGRDDAPGDDRGSGGHGADDGAGHTFKFEQSNQQFARRGRGRDDAPGDDRGSGGNGADDGAGHT